MRLAWKCHENNAKYQHWTHLKALYTGLYQQRKATGVNKINQRIESPKSTPFWIETVKYTRQASRFRNSVTLWSVEKEEVHRYLGLHRAWTFPKMFAKAYNFILSIIFLSLKKKKNINLLQYNSNKLLHFELCIHLHIQR